MPLERGPIEPLDPGRFVLDVEQPEFERLWLEVDHTLAGADAVLATIALGVASGAGDDWRRALAQPLDDAGLALDEEAQEEGFPSMSEEADASEEFSARVEAGATEAPAEAWQPLPAPLEMPAELGGFVEMPEGAGGGVGPVAPPHGVIGGAAATVRVQLRNLTQRGLSYFRVGDWLEVEAHGAPEEAVTVTVVKDGQDLGTEEVGATNGEGVFLLQRQVGPEHVGEWREVWRVGGRMAQPEIYFWVLQ